MRLVNIADREYGQLEIMDFVRKNILPKYAGRQPADQRQPGVAHVGRRHERGRRPIHDRRPRHRRSSNSTPRPSWTICARCPARSTSIRRSRRASRSTASRVDRPKAAELGVSIADIANTLRLLVAGDKVSDYNEKGEQYEVHVRSIADARNRLDELKMVTVPSSKFGTVPLDDVVRFEQGHRPGPDQPPRPHPAGHDQRQPDARHVANRRCLDAIDESAEKLNMGPEYTTGLLGKSKEMAKAFRGFFLAFILAFIFVYLCIAAQFESWLHPITILLSLPLTLPFALVSLLDLPPVDQHLLAVGHPRAVRRGEEELDLADRPHQPAPRGGHAASSRPSWPPTATGSARS